MPWMPQKPRCAALTSKGTPCPNPIVKFKDYCWCHEPSREAQRHASRRKKRKLWKAPRVPMAGRWLSKVNDYLISRGYVHTDPRWAGSANLKRVSRESGIEYALIYDVAHGRIEERIGMLTLGKLCGFLKCGPSDLIQWEPFPASSKHTANAPSRGEVYVTPDIYRQLTGT